MHKLQNIKRKNLDVDKYSKALEASINYRIYAEYWYLDILTDGKWECWVYGDYEVIMPVPLQFKLGIKFVIMPIYCQQLGVFYKEEISDELFGEFEKKIHNYRVRSYSFNEENTERYNPKGDNRVNYVLNLDRNYQEIQKGFSKSAKWNLKQFKKSELKVTEQFDLDSLLSLKQKVIDTPLPGNFPLLLKELEKHQRLLSLGVKSSEGLMAYGSLSISKKRMIYFNAAADQQGKKINAPTGVLAEIIERYSDQEVLLDFEGSSIPPIEFFFKGFGGDKNFYCNYYNIKF